MQVNTVIDANWSSSGNWQGLSYDQLALLFVETYFFWVLPLEKGTTLTIKPLLVTRISLNVKLLE
jgi:hypothetical protein